MQKQGRRVGRFVMGKRQVDVINSTELRLVTFAMGNPTGASAEAPQKRRLSRGGTWLR
jgi:hypothetical protein